MNPDLTGFFAVYGNFHPQLSLENVLGIDLYSGQSGHRLENIPDSSQVGNFLVHAFSFLLRVGTLASILFRFDYKYIKNKFNLSIFRDTGAKGEEPYRPGINGIFSE